MTAIPQPTALGDIEYPESDGKPMGETPWHVGALADLRAVLVDRYRDDPDVNVGADQFVYYEEGNRRAVICPDVFVAFGVSKAPRPTFKLWETGRPPTVVFEISSRSTAKEDFGHKQAVCAMLGVAEYFVYDPDFDYLDPPIQGFRLVGGVYRPIQPHRAGGVRSARLGLTFFPHLGEPMRIIDTVTGEELLGDVELREAYRAADAARRAAETALGVTESRLNDEHQARLQAEAETERLRAELERLRSDANG
jgi:Uma2 family endonuclease